MKYVAILPKYSLFKTEALLLQHASPIWGRDSKGSEWYLLGSRENGWWQISWGCMDKTRGRRRNIKGSAGYCSSSNSPLGLSSLHMLPNLLRSALGVLVVHASCSKCLRGKVEVQELETRVSSFNTTIPSWFLNTISYIEAKLERLWCLNRSTSMLSSLLLLIIYPYYQFETNNPDRQEDI